MKFYRCSICGRIETVIEGESKKLQCCDQPMVQLVPKSEDEGYEKHAPYCEIFGNKVRVRVGEIMHPMDSTHYVQFIGYYAKHKFSKMMLKPGDKPEVTFEYFEGGKVYAYCNQHGLWESETL